MRVVTIKTIAALFVLWGLALFAGKSHAQVTCDNSAATYTINLNQSTFATGDTFFADLILNEGECIQSTALAIEYNNAVLEVIDVSVPNQAGGGIFTSTTVLNPGTVPGLLKRDIANLGAPVGTSAPISGIAMRIEFEVIADGASPINFAPGSDGLRPRLGVNDSGDISFVNNVPATNANITTLPAADVKRITDGFDNGNFTTDPTWFSTQDGSDFGFVVDDAAIPGGPSPINGFYVRSNPDPTIFPTATLLTNSSIFNHWKFSIAAQDFDNSSRFGIVLMADQMVDGMQEAYTGYYFGFNPDAEHLGFYKKTGSSGPAPLLDSLPIPDFETRMAEGLNVRIVRNDNGRFHIYIGSGFTYDSEPDEYLGSFFEGSSPVFESSFTGFYYANMPSGSAVYFDNIDHGIPATVLQGVNGQTNAHLLASPVANTTYAQLFSSVFTQGYPGSDLPGAATPNVYVYDETEMPRNDMLGGSYKAPNDASNIVGTRASSGNSAGLGVLAYIFDDSSFPGEVDGWPKVLEVDGTFNEGDVNIPLAVTNSGSAGEFVIQDDGWNLVGNPYLRSISASSLIANSVNLFQSVYVWDQSADGGQGAYRVYVQGTGGTLQAGLIPPFQGFWAKGNEGGSSSLNFREDFQVTGSGVSTYDVEDFEIPKLEFIASSGQISSTAMIAFNPEAKTGTDVFDAFKLHNSNENRISMFSRSADGHALVVNSMPAGQSGEMRIPLYLTSTFAEQVEFTWEGLHRFDLDWEFELLDNFSGERIPLTNDGETITVTTVLEDPDTSGPLSAGTSQPVTLSAGDVEARFTLIVNPGLMGQDELPEQVKLDQNYPNPFNPTTQISFTLPEQVDVSLEIYDITGRRIATLINESRSAGAHSVTWDASSVSSGVYIYRLRAGNTVLTRKMTLIK